MVGGQIKQCRFQPGCLDKETILKHYEAWEAITQWECPQCTVVVSVNMNICPVCNFQREIAMSKDDRKELSSNPLITQIMNMGYPGDVVRYAMNQTASDDPQRIT
eukprot:UN20231